MPRLLLAAGAVVFLIAVTGCEGAAPHVTVGSTPSSTPVFASDEEALAAAEAAYGAYLEVSDAIFAEGGANPERLGEVASGDFLDASIAGFQNVAAKGWRSTGRSKIHSIELQKFDPTAASVDVATVYLCDDVSAVDVLDASGASVVSPSRPDRTLFEVSLDIDPSTNRLLVSSQEVWGDGQC